MSITFKILLNKRRKRNDDSYPVILRVYKDSDTKEYNLKIHVKEEDWGTSTGLVKPSNDSFELVNARIKQVRNRIEKQLLWVEMNDMQEASPADILDAVFSQKQTAAKQERKSIIKYGLDQVNILTKSGKVGNALVYSTAVNKLKLFVKKENFPFEDLTYKKLVEFQDYMLADGVKVNTISVYMRTIRAIYNKAIKEGLAPSSAYPFTTYRIKNEKTINRTLTLPELSSIIQLSLEVDTPIWHWRNMFLLSFTMIGINFSDLLTLRGENIVGDRVLYRRMKTHKMYSLLLQPKTVEILSYYTDVKTVAKDQLLLPVLKQTKDKVKLKKDMWQAIKTCNEYLERITKELDINKEVTTYYARYTWANIARGLGYSKDIIGQALGHSYGNPTTSIYLDDYDNEIIDQANSKVIAAVFSKPKPSKRKG